MTELFHDVVDDALSAYVDGRRGSGVLIMPIACRDIDDAVSYALATAAYRGPADGQFGWRAHAETEAARILCHVVDGHDVVGWEACKACARLVRTVMAELPGWRPEGTLL